MRPLPSGFLHAKLRTRMTMRVDGIGHIGTPIQSNIASNLCLNNHSGIGFS
jgi:hypothetical protein